MLGDNHRPALQEYVRDMGLWGGGNCRCHIKILENSPLKNSPPENAHDLHQGLPEARYVSPRKTRPGLRRQLPGCGTLDSGSLDRNQNLARSNHTQEKTHQPANMQTPIWKSVPSARTLPDLRGTPVIMEARC